MQKPILDEKGNVHLDTTVSLHKKFVSSTSCPGLSVGFELGMDYHSVDNTYCIVRSHSHIMNFDIGPEQLEEMARLMREEIKKIEDGKYVHQRKVEVVRA